MRLFASSKTALFLCMTVFMLLCQPAAAAVNKQGQKRLEVIFKDLLQQYSTAAEANGAELKAEGEIMVEPSDFYYAVTLPHLTLSQADGSYTEIGMIAANVMPGETDDLWKMTLAIPTPVIHYDQNGGPATTVNMGSQNFAGIWNEKFNNFTKINAKYQNIIIRQHKDQADITIPEATLTTLLTDDDKDNLWTGPSDLKISGLRVNSEKDGSGVAIKEITMNTMVSAYNPEAIQNYQEQLDALSENYVEGEDNVSGQHVIGLYNMLFNFLGNGLDGFSVDFGVKDLSITYPATADAPEGGTKIDNAAFGFGMDGFRAGAVNTRLQSSFNADALKSQKDSLGKAVPSHVNLDLRINNLPYKDIVALGRETLQISMQEKPGAAKAAGGRFIAMLPALLTKANTTLALNDTALGNDHYNVATNGALTADHKAAFGVTGQISTSISGLENLIASLQEIAADPDTSEAEKTKIQQTLSGLMIVQMVGQIKEDASGKQIRVYDLSITKEGQALLNGTDLQMLMQGVPGAAKKP